MQRRAAAMPKRGLLGRFLFASTGVAIADSGPGLGFPNCLGKDLFPRHWIAVNQQCGPRPRNIAIAPSIWANGHYAPAPVQQPQPQFVAHTCLHHETNASLNLDNMRPDARFGAASWQQSRRSFAYQQANATAYQLEKAH